MESDDEVLQFSSPEGASPPVPERKLKRLKKAIRVSQDLQLKQSNAEALIKESSSSKLETLEFKGSDERLSSSSGSEEFDRGNILDSGFTGLGTEEDGLSVKRALDFGDLDEGPGENGEDRGAEIREESGDVLMEELEKKRPSSDCIEEEKEKKKKKRKKKKNESSGDDEKTKETFTNKWRSEKVCRLVKF